MATQSGFRAPGQTPKTELPSEGGSEQALDHWCGVFGVFGVLFVIVGVLGGFIAANESDDGSAIFFGLVFGVVGAMSAFFTRTLLRGMADIVRLLKKQNGIPYVGQF
jgi:hypothetical protein